MKTGYLGSWRSVVSDIRKRGVAILDSFGWISRQDVSMAGGFGDDASSGDDSLRFKRLHHYCTIAYPAIIADFNFREASALLLDGFVQIFRIVLLVPAQNMYPAAYQAVWLYMAFPDITLRANISPFFNGGILM